MKAQKTLVQKYTAKLPGCAGCYYNRYNQETPGDRLNAPTDGAGCWHLADAKKCILLVYYSSSDVKKHVLRDRNGCWRNHIGYGERVTAAELRKLQKEGKVY